MTCPNCIAYRDVVYALKAEIEATDPGQARAELQAQMRQTLLLWCEHMPQHLGTPARGH